MGIAPISGWARGAGPPPRLLKGRGSERPVQTAFPSSSLPDLQDPLPLKFPGLGCAAPNSAEALARSWRSWRRVVSTLALSFRGATGPRRAAARGAASMRPACTQTCAAQRAPQSPLLLSGPSTPQHLWLRKENSPRSRAQSFLRDFPENPHELATVPLGVSSQSAPRPSLVLSSRVALAQAGNPRTAEAVSPLPFLRGSKGFVQGGIPPPCRPL